MHHCEEIIHRNNAINKMGIAGNMVSSEEFLHAQVDKRKCRCRSQCRSVYC
ncbi:hypothetical protein DPMN_057528 [Dreissena polymorpha]|uniref:Uncharacterized protein n=1 Tax=Dreissena polymorpha TaxID=45954 RepID=A0A9D4HC50_DREPO|nr:hypothetical protein DPMN_057528 [Dreissena polymorpha]